MRGLIYTILAVVFGLISACKVTTSAYSMFLGHQIRILFHCRKRGVTQC